MGMMDALCGPERPGRGCRSALPGIAEWHTLGLLLWVGLLTGLISAPLHAAHVASGLVITEVAFDTTDESTQPSSEYIEIFNPSDAAVSLNSGAEPGKATSLGAWFLADFFKSSSSTAATYYYQVVKGKVAVNTTQDGIFQFPQGASIPPKGTVVVTSSSEKFLAEFFGSSTALAAFKSLPGRPQLFETVQDGTADGVPDMLVQSSYTTGVGNLSLGNGGEVLVLYFWDGRSDLIKDGDIVVWKPSSPAPELVAKKSTDALDGPDSDLVSSFFPATDLASSDSLLLAPPASPTNAWSAQRKNIEEPLEADSGGNGLGGQDETSERWGLLPNDQSPNPSWVYERMTPGLPLILMDGQISDAVSFLKPAAVSSADGSLGNTSPLDYGADGTLTELFLWPTDSTSDQDYLPDSLYVAVRGELFGSSDSINASLVLLDIDPGKSTGVRRLDAVGQDLSDTTGALDTRITRARYILDGALGSGFGLDAVMGVDGLSTTQDSAGWRTWGTAGSSGTVSNFAYGSAVDVAAGSLSSLYAGAAGTRRAGPAGFEGLRAYSGLSTSALTYVLAGAVTVNDSGTGASPNTLPETSSDDLSVVPQKLLLGTCIELSSGMVVQKYVDLDGDGVGSQQFCGAGSTGTSTTGGDCNDSDGSATPGKPETCDLKDNNCNGQVDEGVMQTYYADGDQDGYGTSAVVSTGCVLPVGFSLLAGDCDDTDPDANPGELERCDGLDNNCSGRVDEGLETYTWYVDEDEDGYGHGEPLSGCAPPEDAAWVGGDCLDTDATLHPGVAEVCDGLDNNCSGEVDEDLLSLYYPDADGDGVGTGQGLEACSVPAGSVALSGDCNDTDPRVAPGLPEVCDGLDNNCNTQIDEGVTSVRYVDADGDGYGSTEAGPEGCAGQAGYSANSLDCADDNATIHPDIPERCDGLDTDCDPTTDEALDHDGDSYGACTGDCDDDNAAVSPDAAEQCNDGADDDCNPLTDETLDGDEDGASVCEGDCADDEPAMGPDGPELACDDGLDNDCDVHSDLEDVDCVEGATPTPGTVTPGTETPGTVTPGTVTPGTVTPGTVTPGTETPGGPTDAPSSTPAASPTLPGESPTETSTPNVEPPTAPPSPTVTPEGGTPTVTPTQAPEPTRSPRPTQTPEQTPTVWPTPATPDSTAEPTATAGMEEPTPSDTPEQVGGGCGCRSQGAVGGSASWFVCLGWALLRMRRRHLKG